jgi:hypothetical protein
LLNAWTLEDVLASSGSKTIPINKYDGRGTSQIAVTNDHGNSWRDKLERLLPVPGRILRLIKNPSFPWKTVDTTEILGVLQEIPKVPKSVYEQMREALRGFHDSGVQSATNSVTHDKRSGVKRPTPHIGFWAKGSIKRDGKPLGYPWVTKDTTLQKGVALQHLEVICHLLRDHFNSVIMKILKIEDPKLWWRMSL